jgi:hypothetical protein
VKLRWTVRHDPAATPELDANGRSAGTPVAVVDDKGEPRAFAHFGRALAAAQAAGADLVFAPAAELVVDTPAIVEIPETASMGGRAASEAALARARQREARRAALAPLASDRRLDGSRRPVASSADAPEAVALREARADVRRLRLEQEARAGGLRGRREPV